MSFPASFYYHDVLSPEETRQLLTEDQSYLVRRSPLNPDKFILSYFVNSRIKHEIIENEKKVRKNVSFQDVSGDIEDMVSSNQNCVHAVVPPPPGEDHNPDPKSRDEILARKMKLPCKVADIINSPMDSFNDLLTRPGLSSKQIEVCHDIRRRGKNKSEGKSDDEDDCDDGPQDEHPSTSSSKTKRKGAGSKAKKKQSARKNSSTADREAKDVAKTVKEKTKKKAKVAIRKAKLAAVNNVQKKDNPEVTRGRRREKQPQCYVCYSTFDNSKRLSDHLNSHRVRKCEPCGS